MLFHHDPGHSDADLDGLFSQAIEMWGSAPNPPVMAYDGLELDLAPMAGRHVLVGLSGQVLFGLRSFVAEIV